MATGKRIVLRVIAAVVAVGTVVLVAGIWWGTTLYQSEQADSARAAAAFAEVRQRFPGVNPAFEIRDARLVVTREAPAAASPTPAAAAYMLVWQPREQTLARVTVPLWMSKVATEPLPLEALAGVGEHGLGALMEAKRRGHELNIRIGDLERYGRTLLLDGITGEGKRVMMWNE
jgi:hypothetical protein